TLTGSGQPNVEETFEPVVQPGSITLASNGSTLRPSPTAGGQFALQFALPLRATQPFTVTEPNSTIELSVALAGTAPVDAAFGKNLVVYADALGPGSTVYHNVTNNGLEDFVTVPDESRTQLTYQVSLRAVAGLRLGSNTLEFLDASGD